MPTRPAEPFAASIEVEGKTFWYYRAFRDKRRLEEIVRSLQGRGYKTYVVTKVYVDALYTYPNVRWGMS